ncbi:enoyl-CoA hydratase [Burkholderia ubonensis]|uniref:enoyl-CoA hydratase n=1 Tax=Burkholderia ubonensis TaxID=101571 RepID=UPI0008FE855F|nr:enoyl-CoA hydratase [Burkholderia ubonensis]
MAYENILVETRGRVGLVTLNRPKALNALNDALMDELGAALKAFDADEGIGAIVVTGSEKAFAAGADIGMMSTYSYMDVYKGDYITRNWEVIRQIRKPIIAAVAGFALGGGCELAMMCDIIFAADTAKFGQPEIKLGIMPGAGGTQRLPRAVSKAKAMDMCLTARFMDAAEAERAGLVSRVLPADKLLDEGIEAATTIAEYSLPAVMMVKESVNRAYETTLAEGVHFERRLFHSMFATEDQKEGEAATTIAEYSLPAVMMVKESVNRAYETTLAEGVHFERRLFHSMFATEDQKEGMAAFVEKRKPVFKHR